MFHSDFSHPPDSESKEECLPKGRLESTETCSGSLKIIGAGVNSVLGFDHFSLCRNRLYLQVKNWSLSLKEILQRKEKRKCYLVEYLKFACS